MNNKYWVCIIGPVGDNKLQPGSDAPPRNGAIMGVEGMGIKSKNCWSGWGCDEKRFKLLQYIWNTKPKELNKINDYLKGKKIEEILK